MNHRTSVGLDVHARSIAASALDHLTGEVTSRSFPYDPVAVAEWVHSLEGPARCVYESGPTGFDLQRQLEELGVDCCVGAVSKMLRPSGCRVKTDAHDATFLARMLAVGNVVEVAVPSPAIEAARDLSRAREDCRHDLMRARHHVTKLLLRKGIVYKDGTSWTRRHMEWLSRLRLGDDCEQTALDGYLEAVRFHLLSRQRIDAAIAGRSKAPDLAPVVSALSCLRGISTVSAFAIAVEAGDFSRFPNARSFMSYLGLVPSESSSGETTSRGGITRTGNSHVRRLLVESAWHHARPLRALSRSRLADESGVPAEIVGMAERANERLARRSAHLAARGKPANKVNVAIARELAGFVWSIAIAAMAAAEAQ